MGLTCSGALPAGTAVRIGSEYTDDLLEHAWQRLLGKFAYRLVLFCFVFCFFLFLNRSIFSLSESSLFSFELLMCPCYLGLCQTWLLEILCTLYS